MININEAILQAKKKPIINTDGSECYDFDDVVLLRYVNFASRYGDHTARPGAEAVMEAVNRKASGGINTPCHLGVKRVVEGNMDVCYVLQEKCPGKNCATKYPSPASFSKHRQALSEILRIPFEHYEKLVRDGCALFGTDYEDKMGNLFYDEKSGFWYIDLLEPGRKQAFDPDNIFEVANVLKHLPKPIKMAPSLDPKVKLTAEQSKNKEFLTNEIKNKMYRAELEVFPSLQRYEKFFLMKEDKSFQRYLMDMWIVHCDFTRIEENDYVIYQELIEKLLKQTVDRFVKPDKDFHFGFVYYAQLLNLPTFFAKSKLNPVKKNNTDEWKDELVALAAFKKKYYPIIAAELKKLPPNEQIDRFFANWEIFNHPEKNTQSCFSTYL